MVRQNGRRVSISAAKATSFSGLDRNSLRGGQTSPGLARGSNTKALQRSSSVQHSNNVKRSNSFQQHINPIQKQRSNNVQRSQLNIGMQKTSDNDRTANGLRGRNNVRKAPQKHNREDQKRSLSTPTSYSRSGYESSIPSSSEGGRRTEPSSYRSGRGSSLQDISSNINQPHSSSHNLVSNVLDSPTSSAHDNSAYQDFTDGQHRLPSMQYSMHDMSKITGLQMGPLNMNVTDEQPTESALVPVPINVVPELDTRVKPTLAIHKREGCYHITVNPLKDPKTLAENESPYMNCTPLEFKICSKKKEQPQQWAFCEQCCCCNCIRVCPMFAEESSDSEVDIEFTPPAGYFDPTKQSKMHVVHAETQCYTSDYPSGSNDPMMRLSEWKKHFMKENERAAASEASKKGNKKRKDKKTKKKRGKKKKKDRKKKENKKKKKKKKEKKK